MKTNILSFSIFLYFVTAVSYSQIPGTNLNITENQDSSRFKYDPLSDNARDNVAIIFGGSDEQNNGKPVSIGTEISGSYYYKEYPWMEAYGVSLALYTGDCFSSYKKTGSFGELSQMYNSLINLPMEQSGRESYIYLAPGISMFSKNRKFSLSLYQRLSTQIFINGNKQIMPYKVNFHF